MPHDKNGKLLEVGDSVLLCGKVTSVQANEDYCNVTISSPYVPPKQMGFTVTCCTAETERMQDDEDQDIASKLAQAKESGEQLARFFNYSHLAEPLRSVSKSFAVLAVRMFNLPRCAERTAGLRKLLEAKDCAVRAALPE